MNFVEELTWRGMLKDMTPGTAEQLSKEPTIGYVGFDPTADSLHIGNLVPIMLLVRFQQAGHTPVALVGGATGMVGDPSGKSEERNLLSEDILRHNQACIKKQLEKFLKFDGVENPAQIVNNYDWFKEMGFLEFIRDVGKHLTVNYMMAKDSVKNRLDQKSGLSFTEFTYQLVQGYDFYWLLKNKQCKLQMGGSDQWGNITTGTELIRRMGAGDAFALTCPLIARSDGKKFGKSEKGNVWLDPEKTSPFEFYQFWRRAVDQDASNYIRIFTMLGEEEIQSIEEEHAKDPGRALLQTRLAEEMTVLVHSREDFEAVQNASKILYGKGTEEILRSMSPANFKSAFEDCPMGEVSLDQLNEGIGAIDLFGNMTGFLASNGEARRMLKQNALKVNSTRIAETTVIGKEHLINDRYIVLQRGRKEFFLIQAV